jgi:hypothetical protein
MAMRAFLRESDLASVDRGLIAIRLRLLCSRRHRPACHGQSCHGGDKRRRAD